MDPADLKPLSNLGVFGYSMHLCQLLIIEMRHRGFFDITRKSEKVYIDATLDLLLDDPRNIEKLLAGWRENFTQHKTDKKGNVIKAKAFLTSPSHKPFKSINE